MSLPRRSKVIVRPATQDDVDVVVQMAREFQHFVNALDPMDTQLCQLDAATIELHAFGHDACVSGLIAEVARQPVGYLLYYFGFSVEEAVPILHVADLFVRENARHKRVGSSLMTEVAKVLHRRGGNVILWTVWRKNRGAIDFYETLGAQFLQSERLMCWRSKDWPQAAVMQ